MSMSADTKTFMTFGGACMHDTLSKQHYAALLFVSVQLTQQLFLR